MSEFEASILILNWNHPEETEQCLKGLLTISLKSKLIVVVDNGSEDDSFHYLKQFLQKESTISIHHPSLDIENAITHQFFYGDGNEIILAKLPDNAGFAGGMNRALRIAAKFKVGAHFLLNNDAEISPEGIGALMEVSVVNDDALVGPVVYDFTNRERPIFMGKKWPHILFGWDKEPERAYREVWSTGYIEGSALLLPRVFVDKMFATFGECFDERYFLYCEDVDLCLRAKQMGHQCLLTSKASAFHKVSVSTGGFGSLSAYYYITRNRILLAKKWLCLPSFCFFMLYYLPSRVLLSCKRIGAIKKWRIIGVVFAGIFDGFIGRFGKINRK